MPETQTATWKLVVGYTAFAIAAFFVSLMWTFPGDAAAERISAEASARGYDVRMGSLGLGLFGLTARDLEVRPKVRPTGQEDVEQEPLEIESLALRPSLFPLGVHFRVSAFGGLVDGAVGGTDSIAVKVHLDEIDPSQGNLKAYSGLDMNGTFSGEVDLTIPKIAAAQPKNLPKNAVVPPAEPDLGQAVGTIALTGREIVLNGGAIESIPALSGGFPKIIAGDLDAKIDIVKGVATVDTLTVKSPELHLLGSGTVKLAKRWEYSDSNIELKFKLEEELKKRLGVIAFGLTQLQSDRGDPTYKVAKMTGYLGKPNFR